MTACDLFGINNRGLTTSVTVNNGSAGRSALGENDEIWLNIRNLSYFGPLHNDVTGFVLLQLAA